MANRKILDQDIDNALSKHGGFFAFGNDQFKKACNPKLKYVSLGGGLYAPKKSYKQLTEAINRAGKDHIKRDLEANTVKKIIWRELANYECQIIDDPADCIEALKPYGITEKQIRMEYPAYWNHCVENDYF